MSDIQQTDIDSVMAAPIATGPGGNKTLINQDEDEIADIGWEKMGVRSSDLGEDDSNCQGVYCKADFGGS